MSSKSRSTTAVARSKKGTADKKPAKKRVANRSKSQTKPRAAKPRSSANEATTASPTAARRATKKASSKRPAKKTAAKKTPAKKASAKKASAKKTGAKKAAAKKVVGKKAAAKKVAGKKTAATKVIATKPKASPTKSSSKGSSTLASGKGSKQNRLSPTRPAPPQGRQGPITAAESVSYRALLEKKREEVKALYHNDVKSGLKAPDDGMEDEVDRANVAYSRELNFAISDGERVLLADIVAAIERLDGAGDFGVCGPCSQPIGRLRLQAVPWARYCIDCQELAEHGLLPES